MLADPVEFPLFLRRMNSSSHQREKTIMSNVSKINYKRNEYSNVLLNYQAKIPTKNYLVTRGSTTDREGDRTGGFKKKFVGEAENSTNHNLSIDNINNTRTTSPKKISGRDI
jgi:hypothetical protein